MINFDFHKYVSSYVKKEDKVEYLEKAREIKTRFTEGDLKYWNKLDTFISNQEFKKIINITDYIKSNCDVFVVIGIGGSYMGSKAVIEALSPIYDRKKPEIIFLGTNLCSEEYYETLEYIKDKEIIVDVISKSGTTLEPSIAFSLVLNIMKEKYTDEQLKDRVIVTTDPEKGDLRELANLKGYVSFTVPENVGGRFSVLTAVGLLPIAVAGIDIDKLMEGAKLAQEKYNDSNIKYNDCYQYAVLRNILYKNNKTMEIFANYEPKMHYFTEWLKQLFGESEGKENKGIFPVGVDFTTDLHSMGQYIQEGQRNMFETVLYYRETESNITINADDDNLDGLNYLAGKDLDYVNKKAMEGTIAAHVTGGVPNIEISIEKLNEENIGSLIYFFELACAMSGSILGVNPFNQPGVEEYKKNMFKLLEKPGY